MTTAIDVSAWTGQWNTHPVSGDVEQVRQSLLSCGVRQIHLASLNTVWGHNLHLGNRDVYEAADRFDEISPVPFIDPTLATWPDEMDRAVHREDVQIIRWLPAYSRLDLASPEADACAGAIESAGRILSIQLRIEDERRQHPRARVPDVALADIIGFAHRHPGLPLIIGGAGWSPILAAAEDLLAGDRIYAETSQMDGVDSLLLMVQAGLGPRLLFGTHAPLFMPLAGMARVILDLDPEAAAAILSGNAQRLLST